MITSITVRCDWPGCQTTLTYAFRLPRPTEPGWKTETDHYYSMHLCPADSRKSWAQVREAQFASAEHRGVRSVSPPN